MLCPAEIWGAEPGLGLLQGNKILLGAARVGSQGCCTLSMQGLKRALCIYSPPWQEQGTHIDELGQFQNVLLLSLAAEHSCGAALITECD